MRKRVLLTIETGDLADLRHFLEACNLIGLTWKIEESDDEQAKKVFRMIKANEFTLEEAQWAVDYVIRAAEERMARAYEPTGICFAHGAEQEKGFQDTIFAQGRSAKERVEYFLECLLEDLRTNVNVETVRPPSMSKKKMAVEGADTA